MVHCNVLRHCIVRGRHGPSLLAVNRAHYVKVYRRNAFPFGHTDLGRPNPGRRQLSVAHGVLDRLVAQIALDRTDMDALIGQLVATGVAQHVRVDLHIEARSLSCALDHCLKARVENGAPRSLTKTKGDPVASPADARRAAPRSHGGCMSWRTNLA